AEWWSQGVAIDGHLTPHLVYGRDILQLVKHLFGKPEFTNCMMYGPEEHYTDEAATERLYNKIHTGKWWARTQVDIGKGTVIPIVISTDKTTLTQFSGNHTAYPVYMTIGNIDKETRKKPSSGAWVLLGYLPTGKFDEDDMSDNAARKARARLFHASMRILLKPLIKAGKEGIHLVDSKGRTRLCFPVLAIYPSEKIRPGFIA
ncbi:hypothetical protein SISSUDRAFT_995284, partial [Sistotremastrum suecicum HHB10207 ss-3]